jgi:hypothetical protein
LHGKGWHEEVTLMNANMGMHRFGALCLIGATFLAIGCASQQSHSPDALANEQREAPAGTVAGGAGAAGDEQQRDWGSALALISDLISELPAVDHPPSQGERTTFRDFPISIAACGLSYQLVIDHDNKVVWLRRTSGFAGIIEHFGPLDINDPRVLPLIERSQRPSLSRVPG